MSLYTKYEALSPIHSGGLTNHLPMLLNVLQRFNVSDALIEQILDQYRDEHAIFDLTLPNTPRDEFDDAYVISTGHYLSEINRDGIELAVSNFLEAHVLSIPSGLFHGVIRLMFAVLTDEAMQIAQAMAYFDLVSSSYELTGQLTSSLDLKSKLETNRLLLHESNFKFSTDYTDTKFNELKELPIVKDNLLMFENGALTKEEILDIILNRYLETDNFYILHLITGFEAIDALKNFNYNFVYTLKQFFLVSQVFMLFTTRKDKFTKDHTHSFEYIRNHIVKLEDPHDVKLIYSVYTLSKKYNNDKLLTIANKVFKKNEQKEEL